VPCYFRTKERRRRRLKRGEVTAAVFCCIFNLKDEMNLKKGREKRKNRGIVDS
jgi:hypothetical protein